MKGGSGGIDIHSTGWDGAKYKKRHNPRSIPQIVNNESLLKMMKVHCLPLSLTDLATARVSPLEAAPFANVHANAKSLHDKDDAI